MLGMRKKFREEEKKKRCDERQQVIRYITLSSITRGEGETGRHHHHHHHETAIIRRSSRAGVCFCGQTHLAAAVSFLIRSFVESQRYTDTDTFKNASCFLLLFRCLCFCCLCLPDVCKRQTDTRLFTPRSPPVNSSRPPNCRVHVSACL